MAFTRAMARKRVKRDMLSELPDYLLFSHILSSLSVREIIRCSVLSRRWQFLWRAMTHLNFSLKDFPNPQDQDRDIQLIIDKVLHLHSAPIQSFQFQVGFRNPGRTNISSWIHLAALKDVKEITLQIFSRSEIDPTAPNWWIDIDVPDSLFECKSLTNLHLRGFTLAKIPTDFMGFQFLKTFRWESGLNDVTLHQLILLCPLVENLSLRRCVSLMDLKICASNLNYLCIERCESVRSLEVACTQLLEIKLHASFHLQEFKLLERLSAAELVKKITLINGFMAMEVPPEAPSVAVLGSFPRLEELTIHGECFQEIPESVAVDMTFPNLKKVSIYPSIVREMRQKEVTYLGFLLRNSPFLNVMRLFWTYYPENILDQVLDLEQTFPKAKLCIASRRNWSND